MLFNHDDDRQIGFINFIESRISATEFHYHIHIDQIRSEKCIFSFLSILTDMDNGFCFLLCENHWSLLCSFFSTFTCRIQFDATWKRNSFFYFLSILWTIVLWSFPFRSFLIELFFWIIMWELEMAIISSSNVSIFLIRYENIPFVQSSPKKKKKKKKIK